MMSLMSLMSYNIICWFDDINHIDAHDPQDIAGGFAASSGANAITSNRFNYCMNLKALFGACLFEQKNYPPKYHIIFGIEMRCNGDGNPKAFADDNEAVKF